MLGLLMRAFPGVIQSSALIQYPYSGRTIHHLINRVTKILLGVDLVLCSHRVLYSEQMITKMILDKVH